MPFEEIDLTGLEIDAIAWRGERLQASFGGGFGDRAVVGVGHGLQGWTLSSSVQADADEYNDDIDGMPSFEYYHDFIKRHITGSTDIFIIDYRGRKYHASFVENGYAGDMLTYDLFGNSGVLITMRKVAGETYNADGSISGGNLVFFGEPVVFFGEELTFNP